jgi:hypothetical protein
MNAFETGFLNQFILVYYFDSVNISKIRIGYYA